MMAVQRRRPSTGRPVHSPSARQPTARSPHDESLRHEYAEDARLPSPITHLWQPAPPSNNKSSKIAEGYEGSCSTYDIITLALVGGVRPLGSAYCVRHKFCMHGARKIGGTAGRGCVVHRCSPLAFVECAVPFSNQVFEGNR